jgi:hypothetical protein
MAKPGALLFASFLLLSACASTDRAPFDSVAPADQVLVDQERLLLRALVRSDRATLNGLLAEDFSCAVTGKDLQLAFDDYRARYSLCTGLGPREYALTDEIQALETGLPRSAEITSIDISREGDSATVVSTQVYHRWFPYDGQAARRANVTDTWVLRDGSWKLQRRVSEPLVRSGASRGKTAFPKG